MTHTHYQVMKFNSTKNEWFRYKHIPECASEQECRKLFERHLEGSYKGSQFKPWMRTHQFKLVRIDQSSLDIDIL